jgi:molecular chaperone GrpE
MSETTQPAEDRERGPEQPAPAEAAQPQAPAPDGADAAADAPAASPDEDAQRYLEMAQRTKADFENYKRRSTREIAEARGRGAGGLARELLPALDNLDRAIDHAAADDPLLQGVAIVRDEIVAALARAGIEAYSPLGEPFDPTLHEAVATAPAPDGPAGSGTVIDVYQAGYRLGESVIRPARVVVGA